jgi:hypothetical protein
VLYVCWLLPWHPVLSADTGACRRVATFPRDWSCESSIHPTWSACASRHQGCGRRFQSARAPSVPVSVRRVMSTTKSDCGAGDFHANRTRDNASLFFLISPLSFHVYANPQGFGAVTPFPERSSKRQRGDYVRGWPTKDIYNSYGDYHCYCTTKGDFRTPDNEYVQVYIISMSPSSCASILRIGNPSASSTICLVPFEL